MFDEGNDEYEPDFDSNYVVDKTTGEVTKRVEGPLFSSPNPGHHDGIPARLSVSLIKDYTACPAKAYAKITKQPGNKGLALVNGIAAHEALEKFLKNQSDAQKIFATSFALECDKNGIDAKSDEAVKKFTEGSKMVSAGTIILTTNDFNKKVDPELIESWVNFTRNGRLYVGKVDLMHVRENGKLTIMDYKTSKNAPSAYDLNNDLQFSIYAYGAANDEKLKTRTIWMDRGVWLHLRGKNVSSSRKKAEKVYQYSFPTIRTKEQVERDFTETIEPVAARMESGDYYRVRGSHCSWCSYFNAEKKDCGVDLPTRVLIHAGQDPGKAA